MKVLDFTGLDKVGNVKQPCSSWNTMIDVYIDYRNPISAKESVFKCTSLILEIEVAYKMQVAWFSNCVCFK